LSCGASRRLRQCARLRSEMISEAMQTLSDKSGFMTLVENLPNILHQLIQGNLHLCVRPVQAKVRNLVA
jgi:hypothetical protein